MLVLTRRKGETIMLDFSAMSDVELISLRSAGPIKVTMVELRSDKARLGFDAPDAVKVYRKEIYDIRNPSVEP